MKLKLFTKLVFLFLFITIIPLTVAGFLIYRNSVEIITQNTFLHLNSISVLKEAEFNLWIDKNKKHIMYLASRPLIKEFTTILNETNTSNIIYSELVDKIRNEHLFPSINIEKGSLEVFLMNVNTGEIMVSTEKNHERIFMETEPFFINGKNQTFVQTAYYSMLLEKPAMTISTPVINDNGEIVGVLASRIDLNIMTEIMMTGKENTKSEETYLVNKFHFFITESRFESDYSLKKAIYSEGVNKGLSGESGLGIYTDYRGIPVIGAYRWLPKWELCILTEIDTDEAFSPIYSLTNTYLISGVIVLIITVILTFYFSRSVTKPVNDLVLGANKIGKGDLDYQIKTKSKDEIGDLANEFNDMGKRLKKIMASRDELDREIAERKKIMTALKESEDRYRAIVEDQIEMVMRFLPDNKITFINRAMEKFFNLDEKKQMDYTLDNFMDKTYIKEFLNAIKTITPENHIIIKEQKIVFPDQKSFWLQWSIRGFFNENNNIYQFQGVGRDITSLIQIQKELEKTTIEADQANRAKSEFLANMSHELRTPLNGILGFSQILDMEQAGPLNEKQKKYLQHIRDSGDHLLNMVNDILDLAKIEASKVEINKMPFDFYKFIIRAPSTIKSMALKKKIHIKTNISPDIGWLNGDELRIKQIINNLLSNAYKFTDPGKNIGIDAKAENDKIIVTIWDEGMGIPEESLIKIFDPFEQAKSNKAKTLGTGLGLTICKRLIELHDGTLSVKSKIGIGSRFTITFPGRIETVDKKDGKTQEHEIDNIINENKGKLLIVEDNKVNMELIITALKLEGYTLDYVDSGEKAIEKSSKNEYDCILLDIQLPGIDGIETLKQLREVCSVTTPVIALTAYAMIGDREKYMNIGFDEYISKPIDLKILTEIIKKVI